MNREWVKIELYKYKWQNERSLTEVKWKKWKYKLYENRLISSKWFVGL